jgi:hypothetical protein
LRRRTTEAAISPMEHQSRARVSPPLSKRVICSTLATSSDMPCDSRKTLCASALRSSGAMRSPPSARLEEAPEITASGVRRSCEIEDSSALRMRSVSAWIASSACAWARRRAVSVSQETISPTASIMAKVSRYCGSSTWKVPEGGTKKKLYAAMARIEAATTGPRRQRNATSTTPSRYTSAMLTCSSQGARRRPTSVHVAIAPAAQA